MAQSLARLIIHIVFSTKNREPVITKEVQSALHGYLASVGRDLGCEVYRVGGISDHVHLAIDLSRTLSVAEFIKKVKQTSSAWIKEQDPALMKFEWQVGYGAFSVGQSQLSDLIEYIENQEAHHRKRTFKDEYRSLLERYGVDAVEEYLWD